MANTQQGYGGHDEQAVTGDEPTPPAAPDDWGLGEGEADEFLQQASSPPQE